MAEPKMLTTWDGFPIHAEKADKDSNGNSITLGFDDQNEKVVSIGGKAIVGGDDGAWETKGYGTIVTDETGDVLIDEDGNGIADETQAILWSAYKDTGFGAERAVADEVGNNIVETYVTKDSLARVASTGSYNDLSDKPTAIVDQQFDATSTNAQSGKAVAEALAPVQAHMSATNNPHAVTKAQVGLENVDNTSDETKKTNFTGQIDEDNTGFVTGGEAYTALSGKANNAEVVHLTGNEAISGIKEFDSKIRQLIDSSVNKVYRGTYTLGKPDDRATPWNDWIEEYKNTSRKPYRMWTYYAANGLPGTTSTIATVFENCFYVAKLTVNVSSNYTDEQNTNKRFGTIEALCYLIDNQIHLHYINSTGIGNSFKIAAWTKINDNKKYIRIFSLETQYDDYIDSIVVDWVSNQFEYSDKQYYLGEYIRYNDFHETDGKDSAAQPFYSDEYGWTLNTTNNLLYDTFDTILSNPIKSNVYYLTEHLDVDLTNSIWWSQLAQDTGIVLVNKTSSEKQVKIYEDTYVTIPAAYTDLLPSKRFMYDAKRNRWYAEKTNQANWNTTDETDPSFIVGKPYIHKNVTYSNKINDTSGGNYNTHTIDSTDMTNGYFYLALNLPTAQNAGIVRLLGDIFGFRGLHNDSAKSMTSAYISSIDIILGDENKVPIKFKDVGGVPLPIIIRRIDASEFAKSDRNVENDTSTGETRFHFMHFGACRSNMEYITDNAYYLLIKVNMATNTSFVEGDKFGAYVAFTQF